MNSIKKTENRIDKNDNLNMLLHKAQIQMNSNLRNEAKVFVGILRKLSNPLIKFCVTFWV